MKIGIQAWGTDGDIEPLLAIGVELSERGHQVFIDLLRIKKRDYNFLKKYKNLNARIIEFPEERLEAETQGVSKQFWDSNNPSGPEYILKRCELVGHELTASAQRLCQIADVVLGTQHTLDLCLYAEKYKKFYFSLCYEHSIIRSKEFPPIGYECDEEEWRIFMWDRLADSVNDIHRDGINKYRRELGLPDITDVLNEITHSKLLNLISYSANLYPRNPADWQGRHYTCGYINSENLYSAWEPPTSLIAFVESGEKPVFVSFSNMIHAEDDVPGFQNMVIRAIRRAGKRAIFLSNWTNNDGAEEDIYKLSGFVYLPKVIQLCSLVIHPGGAGFTHDAAKSGLPCITVPYSFDQFYNADVLLWHGLSKFKIPRVDVNEANLAEAITQSLQDDSMKALTKVFAENVAREKGHMMAADLIEEKYALLTSKASAELVDAELG
jgi:sterol 3beta-glucosyltransferase